MEKQNLRDLIQGFDFPFEKSNFEQWLVGNQKRLNWFFHREGKRLTCLLLFDKKSAAAVHIFSDGELKVESPSENQGERALAFICLLLKGELPYPWDFIVDQAVHAKVIKAFVGLDNLSFKGSILDLNGNSSTGIQRAFNIEGYHEVNDYALVEDYLFSRFVEQGREPYPCHVLKGDKANAFYAFFNSLLSKRKFSALSQLETVYLVFSDKTLISLLDFYFHPYSALLDEHFLEALSFETSNLDLDLYFFTENYSGSQENNFAKSFLEQTLESDKSVWFVRNIAKKNLEFLQVKGFGGQGKSQWSLNHDSGGISLNCRPSDEYEGSLHLGSSRYYNTYTKSIFHATLKDELAFWRSKGLRLEGMTFYVPQDTDVDDLLYWVDLFNTKFHQSLSLEVLRANDEKIGFVADLVDKKQGRVEFSLLYQGERVGFPRYVFGKTFNAFASGLGACFYEDNKELAPRSKGTKRQNTLKLLRHAGFFHLAFHECVKAMEEGINEKKLIETLKELALAAVLKQIHARPKFNELWSREFGPKAAKLLAEFVANFMRQKPTSYTFQSSEGIFDCDLTLLIPKLNGFLSEFFKNSLGEDILTKSRFKELSIGEDGASFFLEGAIAGILLSEAPEGCQVLLEGKELESLTEADLRSVFKADSSNKEAIDWFELHPEVFLKGKRVDNPEDLIFHGPGCVEHGGRFYLIPKKTLPKMKWLDYFWKKLASNRSKKSFSWDAKIEQIPKNETLELLAMREAGIEIEANEQLQKLFAAFDEMKERKAAGSFSLPLKPFQKIGAQWMLDLHGLGLGGILADDMGLGKTVQSIGALEALREKGQMGHCLVVVPTSLTYNWISEVEKFAPAIPVFNFSGQKRDKHEEFLKNNPHSLTVITYGLFARNCKNLENDAQWNIVLFDEAQNLKNITATRTGYARKFPCRTKFCLTGTPMENHFGEFYSLIDLSVPGALGSYSEFMKVYNFKASKGVDFDKMRHNIEYLKLKTKPLVMRRTKENILTELPDKMETTLKLEFEKKQEKIYRDIAIAYNKKIKEVVDAKGDAKSQLEILSAILRLRQACSYPQALPEIKYDEQPPKLEALFGQIDQVTQEGHKSLVFTNFKSTLDAIQLGLKQQGIQCFVISGATPKAKREKILKEFEQSTEAAVLGMTLKTGGVGLNLTCANYVFHVEPWWNPAAEAQATDRAHRMGQTRKVQVYRYIMKDSIEEKIELLKSRKSLAIESLLSEDSEKIAKNSLSGSGLTFKDFQYLLS